MARLTKRAKNIAKQIDKEKLYPLTEAIELLSSLSTVKFKESIDVAINLGVDAKKSDQVVRGATVLPRGTGKTVRVAVFSQGNNAEAAKEAGADLIGMDDLAEEIKKGEINFDVAIASPDAMRVVGSLGSILGPRGLMPNPKVGTVTTDVATAVKNAKSGQVRYRTDKAGIIQCSIGQVGFEPEAIEENLTALINALNKAKPPSSKGTYIEKISLSTTMGPGLHIDKAELV